MVDTFQEFKELKNIDRSTMISVLEESFRSVLAKMFGTDENFDIIINPDKGDFEIYKNREVVADDELTDPNLQVSLSEARQTVDDIEIGEDFTEEVHFEKFGRRAILNLRQTLAAKILELQKDLLYNKYKDLIGRITTAEVYQIWKREMLMVDEDGNELSLPRSEQIPGDNFRKNDQVRAVVLRVDNTNNNPKIILSRTAPIFLQHLMEQEIPEVADGTIRIVKIVRLPGERAKIAVETNDDRIDPVGACVGVKGGRIHGIVREFSVPFPRHPSLRSMSTRRTRPPRYSCVPKRCLSPSARMEPTSSLPACSQVIRSTFIAKATAATSSSMTSLMLSSHGLSRPSRVSAWQPPRLCSMLTRNLLPTRLTSRTKPSRTYVPSSPRSSNPKKRTISTNLMSMKLPTIPKITKKEPTTLSQNS